MNIDETLSFFKFFDLVCDKNTDLKYLKLRASDILDQSFRRSLRVLFVEEQVSNRLMKGITRFIEDHDVHVHVTLISETKLFTEGDYLLKETKMPTEKYKAKAIFEYHAWDSFISERQEVIMHSHEIEKVGDTKVETLTALHKKIESIYDNFHFIDTFEDRIECGANYRRDQDEPPLEHERERYYITIFIDKITSLIPTEEDASIFKPKPKGG